MPLAVLLVCWFAWGLFVGATQVPPNSLANRQKAFFDEAFDPFFRVNQVGIVH